MKRIVAILLAFFAITLAYAEVITSDQAMVLAREFISKGEARFTAGPGIALRLAHEAHSLDGKPDYYVFNNGADGGYIVVSGDDRTVPVWGYSTSGSFDYESMPENVRCWFEEYQREMQFLREHPDVQARQPVTLASSVAHMLTTSWGQKHPYNLFCPIAHDYGDLIYYNDHACTGCVATALAQIMNYHKWPNVGTDDMHYFCSVKEYQQQGAGYVENDRLELLSADFRKSEYKWSKMKDQYGAYRNSNGDICLRYKSGNDIWIVFDDNYGQLDYSPFYAVAQLMKDVGYAVRMEYGSKHRGGSGSTLDRAALAMANYFSYSSLYKKRQDNDENWDEWLREELAAGRPIFYIAENASNVGDEAHAFVIEGYDSQGRFYVNWGWDGEDNGYYYTSLLNPGSYDFKYGQFAMFLTPKNGNYNIEGETVKSLSVAMERGNTGKIRTGGGIAILPFTVYGVNLNQNVFVHLSGPDADQFSLSGLTSIPAADANQGFTNKVKYKPTKAGTHTARLTFTSGADVEPVDIDLKGHSVRYYDANGDASVTVEDLTAIIDALLTNGNVGYTDRSITVADVSGVIDHMLTGCQEMDVNDGLVAYYPFNGDAHDASGHGNDGVLNNVAPTTGTYGEANGAYQFGGYYNPGCIRIPNSESLKFTDGFSFSCFVKPTDWSGQDTLGVFTMADAVQAIFAKSSDRNGPAFQFAGDPSRIKFYSSSMQQASQWCGLNSLDRIQGDKLNNWIHVALTYSDKDARMYIDGALIKSKSITPDFSQMNSHDLYLGRYSNDWYPLNGVLDEVRIYNRALTEIEVLALAEGSEQAYAETHPFKLSQNSVNLTAGDSVTIEILNGNGSYSVGSNKDIVDFTLDFENESITLTGISEGTTNVTVIDVNTQTTILLPVTVTKPQNFNGQIVMERKYFIHYNNNQCFPSFSFNFDNGRILWIVYNYHNYGNEYGIYIRSNEFWNPAYQWIVCPVTTDQWVEEKIIIESNGLVHYYMNGDYLGEYQFGDLDLNEATSFSVHINPYGWYTGHYHYMDDFTISSTSISISDDFNDGILDTNIWQTPVNPSGVREEDGIMKTMQLHTDWDYCLKSNALEL